MDISIKAQQIFSIGSFNVTNGLLLGFVVLILLTVFSIIFRSKIKMVPGAVQGLVEIILEWFLNLMESVLGTREAAEKYFPLIATIFIFILTSNWLGLIPGVGSFIFKTGDVSVPLFRSPAADLNFTLALAVMSVLATNFFGILTIGVLAHVKKFFNFGGPVKFFVGILELISEFARIVSFSFRLFGNIFAGEVLLTIMFFLLPYIVPIPFMIMEIFFGAIQAFIFAMLTLVFLATSTAVHEEEH
jgi:F-type H+-transporting ATPase subunit a